jgi:hypothetical protein
MRCIFVFYESKNFNSSLSYSINYGKSSENQIPNILFIKIELIFYIDMETLE